MPEAGGRDAWGARLALAAVVLLLLVAAVVGLGRDEPREVGDADTSGDAGRPARTPTADPSPPTAAPGPPSGRRAHAADGRIFGDGRFLVAYYGTGGTGALGVLGESDPATMHRRLARAARAFDTQPDREVQLVYELIVTVADGHPGRDGDFSHDVPRAVVERYVEAARRTGALLLLDIQPGRARFLDVAKRWAWALREPHVGLALDPEWRMARDEVPGRVIGAVRAQEVNLVSGWLEGLRAEAGLPEKLFVLHQFRADMVRGVDRLVDRPGLAEVQHVDGFGTPRQKLTTYRAVARNDRFHMGFKLFYDEDRPRMSARDVRRVRPAVRFVSFQ
ncbi:hypothetical protein [Nocardioides litoris]|uniref:hypothetical protein n=1 Tax=Nocardioides litoris TaxID=1926648 RepID=UPI00111ECAB7|nr:hypothetical protein [Nocardioides litoris]